MAPKTITTSEFRKTFGETLDMVYRGTLFVISRHGKPWVKLIPPGSKTEKDISAFALRLNVRELLAEVHYSRKACSVIRKREVVAVIVPCDSQ